MQYALLNVIENRLIYYAQSTKAISANIEYNIRKISKTR